MESEACYEAHFKWRCGRKVGRTIYAQLGSEPSDDDVLIGMMDSPEIAAEVVDSHNSYREWPDES